jgi:hypothetical protein
MKIVGYSKDGVILISLTRTWGQPNARIPQQSIIIPRDWLSAVFNIRSSCNRIVVL